MILIQSRSTRTPGQLRSRWWWHFAGKFFLQDQESIEAESPHVHGLQCTRVVAKHRPRPSMPYQGNELEAGHPSLTPSPVLALPISTGRSL